MFLVTRDRSAADRATVGVPFARVGETRMGRRGDRLRFMLSRLTRFANVLPADVKTLGAMAVRPRFHSPIFGERKLLAVLFRLRFGGGLRGGFGFGLDLGAVYRFLASEIKGGFGAR